MGTRIASGCRAALLVLLLSVVFIFNSHAAADLHGRITDSATGFGIEGAGVGLDLDPVDGTYEHAVHTDVFGFYDLPGVVVGTYTITASHPGYQNGSVVDVAVADDTRPEQSLALDPKHPGENVFDIYVQVSGVMTGLALEGLPVTVAVTPTNTAVFGSTVVGNGQTDDAGFLHLTGFPAGAFTFNINPNNTVPGWDSYQNDTPFQLAGPYTANVQLMPELRTLDVQVYGFDPVTEEDNVLLEGIYVEATGVEPGDSDLVLVPTQTGVSAITKVNAPDAPTEQIWDNSRKGKVRFIGLPPIDWTIDSKRLGYALQRRLITTDAAAQLVYDNATEKSIRVDMTLLPTKLTVVVDSDYDDRQMLNDKITVRIQGLKDTNTAGIDRQGKVVYDASENRSAVEFDRILPGKYRVTAGGTAPKSVAIRAGDASSGDLIKNTAFNIRFAAEAFMDAHVGVNRDVALHLAPQPMTFRGILVKVDHEARSDFTSDYIHTPTAAEGITFRVSDYMKDMIPEAHRTVLANADDKGEFTVTLLPGLYGIEIAAMADYWGDAVETIPADGGQRDYMGWPYHQVWPFSVQVANDNFNYGVGGMPVSSDQELRAMLFVRKDWINVDCTMQIGNNPTGSQVVAIDKSGGPGDYARHFAPFYDILRDSPTLTLNGPSSQTVLLNTIGHSGPQARFTQVLPGNYTVTFSHPRFSVTQAVSYTYEDHNPPGVLPSTAPKGFGSPSPMLPFGVDVPVAYNNGGTADITIKRWVPATDTDPGYYQNESTSGMIRYLKAGFTGERVFSYSGKTPATPYEMWLDLSSFFTDGAAHWYHLESTGGDIGGEAATIYLPSTTGIPGPGNTLPSTGLDIAYNLTVEARDIIDPDGAAITGVSVPFTNGGPTLQSGGTYSDQTHGLVIDGNAVSHPSWSYAYNERLTVDTSSSTPAVTLTVFMRRGVAIRGTIKNAVTQNPIPETSITVTKNHGGGAIIGPPSGSSGAISFDWAYALEVYYIEVNAKGYQTYRKRLDPADAQDDPNDLRTKVHDLTVNLVPLEGPTVSDADVAFDRYGSFLPSVQRSGDQSVFDGFSAQDTLTLTWVLAATRRQHSFSIPQFDDANGNTRSDVTLTPVDDVAEVWLVDLRSFAKNTYDDEAQTITAPAVNEPHLVHAWLAGISKGTTPNLFHQRVARFLATDSADKVKGQGQVPLWELPPGQFAPAFVVVSRMGAVTIYPFNQKTAYTDNALTGMRLPPWMAFMADVLGSVAGTQATHEQVKDFLPKGRFKALPTFTAKIELVDEHFVDYQYAVDVNLKEGMDGPARGLVGLAPGIIGLDLKAKLDAGMNGKERKFKIAVEGGISRNDINNDGFKPAFFRHLPVGVGFHPSPYGSVRTQAAQSLTAQNMPAEFEITHSVDGTVGAKATVSIIKILNKVPYVGPVILLAEKAGAINRADAYMRGLTGLTSTTTWRTVFPHQTEHYSVVGPESRQLRRHFLGGNESSGGQTKFDICFGFGVGLEVTAIGNRVGAFGDVALAGDSCGRTEEPALTVETNPLGDWPPIRRISGDVRATLKAYLDAWLTKIDKKYVWKAIKINAVLGEKEQPPAGQSVRETMAVTLEYPKTTFTLVEMEVTVTETPRDQYPPVDFVGQPPQLIRKFVPIGDAAATFGNIEVMVFTDMTVDGDMLLKSAVRSPGGTWTVGATLMQTAGAIVDTVVAPVGDGWLTVWSEIAEANTGNIYAPSSLRYAVRDAGGTWSAPATVSALSHLGLDLRLIPMGSQTGLVFLETDEGPVGDTFAITGLVWDGNTWGAPVTLAPRTDMIGYEAAGSPDLSNLPARIAYVAQDGTLQAVDWDGTAMVAAPYGPLNPASVNAEEICLILGDDGIHYLAYADSDGGIALMSRASGADWVGRGILLNGVDPGELDVTFLSHDTAPVLLYVWRQGGGVSTLHYGVTATDGTLLRSGTDFTGNTVGRYFQATLLPADGRKATVLARYQNGTVEELRSFILAYPAGREFVDGDQDGIDDAAELAVVDADPADAITTVAQVVPGDDFDIDGYNNGIEMRAGTDPAWAGDHPHYGDILRDGAVTIADAILGLQIITGFGSDEGDPVADVNLDGSIGIQEVVYILQDVATVR